MIPTSESKGKRTTERTSPSEGAQRIRLTSAVRCPYSSVSYSDTVEWYCPPAATCSRYAVITASTLIAVLIRRLV